MMHAEFFENENFWGSSVEKPKVWVPFKCKYKLIDWRNKKAKTKKIKEKKVEKKTSEDEYKKIKRIGGKKIENSLKNLEGLTHKYTVRLYT